jgi:hypothetical protein
MLFALGLSLALAAPGGAQNLHPVFAGKIEKLVQESARAGVPLKLISGYRRFDPHGARAKQGRASWHNFGLAIDVNLRKRSSMQDALRHYEKDKAAWQTVGRIGQRLGLTWGAPWGREEIFHFEWHPGAPAAIRRDTLDSLLAEAGPDGRHFKKTWHRFGGVPKGKKRSNVAKGKRRGKGVAKGERRGKSVAKGKKRRGVKKKTARRIAKTVRQPKRRGKAVRRPKRS